MKIFTPKSDEEWERFARRDPYYAVLTIDRFRSGQLNDTAEHEFFASGEVHVNLILTTIRTHLDPNFSPSRGLDFGCGVGRCTIPLASVCTSVVGVDVSDSMLQEATKNCAAHSVSNVELIRSDDNLSKVTEPFDLVHSFLVFQHIPVKRGEIIFRELVTRLSEGGVGVIHFPYQRRVPKAIKLLGMLRKKVPLLNGFANLVLGNPWSAPLMEKNVYNINRLLLILWENGCHKVYLGFVETGELLGVTVFFQKKPIQNPYGSLFGTTT